MLSLSHLRKNMQYNFIANLLFSALSLFVILQDINLKQAYGVLICIHQIIMRVLDVGSM